MHKPRIAITLGDPAGIGPEIIVAAWANPAVHDFCRPLVVGHPQIVARAVQMLNTGARVVSIEAPENAAASPDVIPCLAVGSDDVLSVPAGAVDPRAGQAAYDAIVAATRLALDRRVDALVTAPISKAALHRAGHDFPGHTELLGQLCGVDHVAMMLYLAPGAAIRGPAGLAIVHVTLHMALADVFASLDEKSILTKARLVDRIMTDIKGARPRIGVCALNPHGGEDGLFGREELEVIAPAVARGVSEGLDLSGPFPADTLIRRARDGEFDALVAMYHDQGHIAIKLLAMHQAVNVTLGLPIVRTSVAHGTAFDLAWQGRAESAGMVEALRVAARLAQHEPAEKR
jgi:4-phospho-D-threonate 3-dehydrogenase / 4-phospho-D-erythronate 3-dehydrogenase